MCIIFFIYTYYFFFRNPSRQNIHGKSGPRVIFGRQNTPDRIAICLIIIDVRRRTVKNVTWPLGTREWFFTGNVFVIRDDSRFVCKHVRLEMVLFTNGYAPYVSKKKKKRIREVLYTWRCWRIIRIRKSVSVGIINIVNKRNNFKSYFSADGHVMVSQLSCKRVRHILVPKKIISKLKCLDFWRRNPTTVA